MIRLYESREIADAYVKYRPSYSDKIVQRVMNYLKEKQAHEVNGEKFDLMVDVGCGSGQSCSIFQPFFKKIIGVDVSEEQLKLAREQNKNENIFFHVGSDGELPVPDNSVNLLVSGIAAHWFNLPKFFSEVQRVLKPHGCMALFGYNIAKVSSIDGEDESLAVETARKLLLTLMQGLPDDPVEKKACMQVAGKYSVIHDAIPLPQKERDDSIHDVLDLTQEEFAGMMRSTNCYEYFMEKKLAELKKKKPDYTQKDVDAIDMAKAFVTELKDTWNLHNIPTDKKMIKLDLHYFLLLSSAA